MTTEDTWGVNYRALQDLFELTEARMDVIKYEVGVQMLEIYNEQVKDLLVVDGSNRSLAQLSGLLKENANASKYWACGGDFRDTPNDLNFYLNGLIWPDWTPHPAVNEVKYCYQPIKNSFTNGVIKITNTNFFQTTEDLEFNWVIEGDRCKLDSGTLSLPTLKFNWVIEGDVGS
ncbi:hypothetical protein Lser_V15G33873 [Lactuca serriola]